MKSAFGFDNWCFYPAQIQNLYFRGWEFICIGLVLESSDESNSDAPALDQTNEGEPQMQSSAAVDDANKNCPQIGASEVSSAPEGSISLFIFYIWFEFHALVKFPIYWIQFFWLKRA